MKRYSVLVAIGLGLVFTFSVSLVVLAASPQPKPIAPSMRQFFQQPKNTTPPPKAPDEWQGIGLSRDIMTNLQGQGVSKADAIAAALAARKYLGRVAQWSVLDVTLLIQLKDTYGGWEPVDLVMQAVGKQPGLTPYAGDEPQRTAALRELHRLVSAKKAGELHRAAIAGGTVLDLRMLWSVHQNTKVGMDTIWPYHTRDSNWYNVGQKLRADLNSGHIQQEK